MSWFEIIALIFQCLSEALQKTNRRDLKSSYFEPNPHPPRLNPEPDLSLVFWVNIKAKQSKVQMIKAAIPEGLRKQDKKAFQFIIRWIRPATANAIPAHSWREFMVKPLTRKNIIMPVVATATNDRATTGLIHDLWNILFKISLTEIKFEYEKNNHNAGFIIFMKSP